MQQKITVSVNKVGTSLQVMLVLQTQSFLVQAVPNTTSLGHVICIWNCTGFLSITAHMTILNFHTTNE